MKSDIFQHELSETSSVFGRKHDVQVVFSGDDACTDGSTVVLPSLALDQDVSDEHAAVMRGYVDHEAGHIRHTDFKAGQKLHEECKDSGNKLLPQIVNALEDIRLERLVMDEYQGAEKNIRATASAVNREFLDTVPADDERIADPAFIGPVALTWQGRLPYGDETNTQCLDRLDPSLRSKLPGWIDLVDKCRNTGDVIELARQVERDLRGSRPKKEEEASAATPGGDAGDSPADADATSAPGDTGDGSSPASGSEDDGKSEQAASEIETTSSGGGGRGAGETKVYTTDDFEVYDPDVAKAVKHTLREADLTTTSTERYRPYSTANDKVHTRKDKKGKYPRYTYGQKMDEPFSYKLSVKRSAGTVSVIRRKLERAIMAKEMRDWEFGLEDGRLDSRRLVSAYAGKPNVFKARSERNELDTAVCMLIDMSGSMAYDRRIRIAMDAAIALSQALEKTSASYEVLGFNSKSRGSSGGYGERYTTTRWEPLDLYVFKDFRERLFDAQAALGSITNHVGGNNVDGESVLWAYERLKKQPQRRKILLVLSDGAPAFHTCDCTWPERHLTNVIERLKSENVDLVGIGIGDHAVEKFYPRHVVLHDLSDLAGECMDQLGKLLLGERFTARRTSHAA